MTNELFIKLCYSVITIISILITSQVIPYIREKIGSEKLEKVKEYAAIAVRCAEQIYPVEKFRDKKNFAIDYVTKMINENLKINLSKFDIENIVESLVYEIKHEGMIE